MFIPIKSEIFKSVVTLLKYPFSQIIWKLLRIWTNAIKKEKNLKLLKPEPCKDEVEKHDWDCKRHPGGERQSREGTKVLKKRRNGFWSSTISWREGGLPCWGFQVQPGLGGIRWQHQCHLWKKSASVVLICKNMRTRKNHNISIIFAQKSKNTNICSISNAH